MSFLNKKRQLIPSKLTFKSKEKLPAVIYPKKPSEHDEKLDTGEIPLNEENQDKKTFKEFISEKDLKRGLIPEKSYNKLTKIDPLPKEYKVYKKVKLTDFQKKHLKKVEKEKKKKSVEQKIENWNFEKNYEKYQKLLTSLPELSDMPRISGA